MINIAIIEDDKFKMERLLSVLKEKNIEFSHESANSVHKAVHLINQKNFDLIFLDMALPSHSKLTSTGTTARSLLSGGIEIILELTYNSRSDPVIIITQYPEVEIDGKLIAIEDLEDYLNNNYRINISSAILYDNDSSNWEQLLIEKVLKL